MMEKTSEESLQFIISLNVVLSFEAFSMEKKKLKSDFPLNGSVFQNSFYFLCCYIFHFFQVPMNLYFHLVDGILLQDFLTKLKNSNFIQLLASAASISH